MSIHFLKINNFLEYKYPEVNTLNNDFSCLLNKQTILYRHLLNFNNEYSVFDTKVILSGI